MMEEKQEGGVFCPPPPPGKIGLMKRTSYKNGLLVIFCGSKIIKKGLISHDDVILLTWIENDLYPNPVRGYVYYTMT